MMSDTEQDREAVGPRLDRVVRRLSPLNLTALLRREVFDYSRDPEQAKKNERKSARYVSAYECPMCQALHKWEDDAEECCQGAEIAEIAKPASSDDYAALCPVCGSENEGPQDASDCCLWKDLDSETRHAIARRVENGSTWARELGIWPPNVRGNSPGTARADLNEAETERRARSS